MTSGSLIRVTQGSTPIYLTPDRHDTRHIRGSVMDEIGVYLGESSNTYNKFLFTDGIVGWLGDATFVEVQ